MSWTCRAFRSTCHYLSVVHSLGKLRASGTGSREVGEDAWNGLGEPRRVIFCNFEVFQFKIMKKKQWNFDLATLGRCLGRRLGARFWGSWDAAGGPEGIWDRLKRGRGERLGRP